MKRNAVAFVALLLAAIASPHTILAQNPTNTPRRASQPESKQRGSEDLPLAVKVIPAERSKAETEQEAEDRAEKKNLDRATVNLTEQLAKYTAALFFATLGLVAVTGGLVYFGWRQSRDMKESLRITDESAKAAIKSAEIAERALVEIQRALVVPVKFDAYVLSASPGNQIGYRVVLKFQNTGSTTAKRFTGIVNVVFTEGLLPDNFDYADASNSTPPNAFVGPQVPVAYPLDLSMENLIAVQDGQKNGFLYGWVEYEDIFTNTAKRRTEICVRMAIVAQLGLPVTTDASPISFAPYGKYNGTDSDCFYKPGDRPPYRAEALPMPATIR